MKYFLTGILGHACPHLAKLLIKAGHEVHALIRTSAGRPYESLLDIMSPGEIEKIIFHYGDLTDYQSLVNIFKINKFDGCFHLGAQSSPPIAFKDPIGTMKTNVNGTIYLIEAIINHNPKCIIMNCSTSEVYGDLCKETGILKEDMILKPNNPYGWSKMCAETYLAERCKNGFITGFSTRGFSHLAPRRGKNFSISWDAYHLALIKLGIKKDKILPVGNLKTKRIVIDARDCMRAYYLLMQTAHTSPELINGLSFNVCGNIDSVKPMRYFTDSLITISGLKGIKKKIDKRVYRPIDIQIQVGDTTKLKKLTGWKPKISLKKTLGEVFNYWIKKLS